jgi:hypothetical protein
MYRFGTTLSTSKQWHLRTFRRRHLISAGETAYELLFDGACTFPVPMNDVAVDSPGDCYEIHTTVRVESMIFSGQEHAAHYSWNRRFSASAESGVRDGQVALKVLPCPNEQNPSK